MFTVEGQSADEVWLAAVEPFRAARESAMEPTRGGPTAETLHAVLSVRDSRQRWVSSRHPALNPAFAIAEIFWILGARDDAQFLIPWNSELPKYVGDSPNLRGAYGPRLRRSFGIDQLVSAYDALRHNRSTRQIVLQIWSASDDLPTSDGRPRDADIPCNICASLKLRDSKLHWLQLLRSNDLMRGTPYNFVQFTTIQEIMAGWLQVEPGEYTHVADSLHVYESDLKDIQMSRYSGCPENGESLAVPKGEFDSILPIMIECIEACAAPGARSEDLTAITRSASLPQSYRNLLLVVAAESARRRKWISDAHLLIEQCTNPALAEMWKRWRDRVSRIR